MSWIRLDDGFHRNQKQLRMTNPAFRLYVCALSFCAQERQPTGYMSNEQAQTLQRGLPGVHSKAIDELVHLNAWEPANGGYLIHDYEEYVEKGSRERTKQWRDKKRHSDDDVTSQRRHGDEPHARARDGYPVPEPVPVKGSKEPRRGDKARARPYVENPVDNWRRIGDLLPDAVKPPEFW